MTDVPKAYESIEQVKRTLEMLVRELDELRFRFKEVKEYSEQLERKVAFMHTLFESI